MRISISWLIVITYDILHFHIVFDCVGFNVIHSMNHLHLSGGPCNVEHALLATAKNTGFELVLGQV